MHLTKKESVYLITGVGLLLKAMDYFDEVERVVREVRDLKQRLGAVAYKTDFRTGKPYSFRFPAGSAIPDGFSMPRRDGYSVPLTGGAWDIEIKAFKGHPDQCSELVKMFDIPLSIDARSKDAERHLNRHSTGKGLTPAHYERNAFGDIAIVMPDVACVAKQIADIEVLEDSSCLTFQIQHPDLKLITKAQWKLRNNGIQKEQSNGKSS